MSSKPAPALPTLSVGQPRSTDYVSLALSLAHTPLRQEPDPAQRELLYLPTDHQVRVQTTVIAPSLGMMVLVRSGWLKVFLCVSAVPVNLSDLHL